jgi:hypothetical protein
LSPHINRRLTIGGKIDARCSRVTEVTTSAESLAQAIIASGVIPPRAVRDAAHVAVAAVHRIDYLLTWNCRHLANAQIMRKMEEVCGRSSERMPLICTPEELMGD